MRVRVGGIVVGLKKGCVSCSDGIRRDIHLKLGFIHHETRYCRVSLPLHPGLWELACVLERRDAAGT